MILIVAHETEK